MKKLSILLLAFFLVFNPGLKADEGMWLLPLLKQLNMGHMNELGLELSAEDIYSINNSSIKDAIVIFGGGCTGEIISDQGLILTNHHCGYSVIQSHSTLENDYLTDGFWAKTMDEEISSPGLSVTFLIRIEDVSDRVLKELNPEMTEQERNDAAGMVSRSIEQEAISGTNYFARVQPFFGGNQYYLMVYERYNDVRMVGTPPSSVGKYGGDTDNWMWPRQTGDFALFRVYTAPDGSPADYSEDNIPMKPKHHLPVSVKGVEAGDFAMVLGYPGGTQRYMTSFEVKDVLEITHPNRIKIRGLRQEILLEDMIASDKVRIQYANKYSGSSNYWKFSIGQSEVLKRLGIYEQKQEIERSFMQWVNSEASRQKQYGNALQLIDNSINSRREYNNAIQYISEAILRSCEIVSMANRSNNLLGLLSEKDADQTAIENAIENLRTSAEGFYKNYNAPTDRKVTAAMLDLYFNDVDKEYHPEILAGINKKYKGDFEKYARDLFKKSIFTSEKSLKAFLVNPSRRKLQRDPALQLALSTYQKLAELRTSSQEYSNDLSRGQRLFIAGLMEQFPERVFYPDANFTMRLTYGTVGGYQPRDAVYYDYHTTIEGVMEKEEPGSREFEVPDKLKELFRNKDYGMYGSDSTLPVNFITNNDITGGNSGSPVINARGELIGLAFDGNWEAMSGDIAFEPELQRCIAVDARYVLFIIDKFAGASHLIEEMTLVN
ncbi:MAG: S46 family peptidase [Bacteroidales bacterium]